MNFLLEIGSEEIPHWMIPGALIQLAAMELFGATAEVAEHRTEAKGPESLAGRVPARDHRTRSSDHDDPPRVVRSRAQSYARRPDELSPLRLAVAGCASESGLESTFFSCFGCTIR